MNTCPSCHQSISLKSLALSVVPLWITCPHCGASLAGSRFVQAVTVGQSLLVAGIALSVGLWVPFLLLIGGIEVPPLFEFDDFAIPVPTPTAFVAMLVPIVITWLAGIVLVRRSGSYRPALAGRRTGGLVTNYLLATGVISIILVSWATIYADLSPIAVTLLVSWAFVPFLVLHRYYGFRLGPRLDRAAIIVLLIWAGLFNLSAIVFATYAGANFPQQGPFEQRLVFQFGPQSEQDAWFQLREVLDADDPDTDAVLDFLATNVVSSPREAADYRSATIRYIPLTAMPEAELKEIRELLDQGNEAAAAGGYLRLWRVADNLVEGNGNLIKHLVTNGIIKNLVDFYLEGDNGRSIPPSPELAEISANIADGLDRSWENAMAWEYERLQFMLQEPREIGQILLDPPDPLCNRDSAGLCLFDLPWPFHDRLKFLRAEHDFWYHLALATGDQDSRSRADEPFKRQLPSKLKNPVFYPIAAIFAPLVSRFSEASVESKARLLIFEYVIDYRLSGEFGNIPTDPLTGEPFLVTDKGDTIQISSADLGSDGEPWITYEVRKAIR